MLPSLVLHSYEEDCVLATTTTSALDLPVDTAAIIANAVSTNVQKDSASNVSQAESSSETLPAAMDTCDMM